MATSNDKLTKILLILGPFIGYFPDLARKKLDEITVKMDENWKIFAVTSHVLNLTRLPCSFEVHRISFFGSQKSSLSRIIYLINCVIKGVKLAKEKKIQVITQHDGHLEYGMVAYIISRLTHRKCLIRVNEDTLIPLIFFLKSSGNPLFRSKTLLKIVAFTYKRIEKSFFKHVDWIITHSPEDYLMLKNIARRITFVPLWIDTTQFKRLDEETTRRLRKKLDIAEDVKILLFVGRLHPEKGVDILLKALKMIKSKKILLLLVYSVSDYKEKYERLAKHLQILDRVRFLGYIPHSELPKYFCAAEMCILPSMREQWSNTIMEAMACMTPVVATEVGANPYIISEGKTGFLVPLRDPQSLVQKIEFILEHPDFARQVAENAAIEVKKYDLNIVGEYYKNAVTNLLKNNFDSARSKKKESNGAVPAYACNKSFLTTV